MKNFNKLFLLVVVMFTTGYIVAQTTQLPKWPLNGKEVDFINQQVNNTSASLSTPKYVSNGYYDRNDDMLFHIIDNNLWWGNGNYAGALFTDIDPVSYPDRMFTEVVVVPTETPFCEDGSFYAFYCVERSQDPYSKNPCPTTDYSLMYNVISTDANGAGSYSSPTNILTLNRTAVCQGVRMGIAATDFLPGTNTRRLYVVYYDDETQTSAIKFFNVSPTGVTGPYTVGSFTGYNNPFEPCEVEISRDRTKLVFTRNKQYAWSGYTNTNDVTIVHLLSNGYLNTSAGTNGYTYIDLGTANSVTDCYVGVEFSANQQDLFVTRAGVGLYKYNISTMVSTDYGPSTLPIANSQLELGRDGLIYGMDGNGQLYTINSSGTFAQSNYYNIGSSGVINNKIYDCAGCTTPPRQVYTIPEQIDGYNYDGLWSDDENYCCYITTESENVRTLNNVTFDSEGNITISGAGSSWSAGVNPFTPSGVPITDVYLKGSINIDTDASLTISGLTLHFKEDEGINMTYTFDTNQEGSKLYLVSNAKLTAFDECDEDALWRGIICEGHWTLSQTPYYDSQQPYIYMNNSTIEFAELGIDAGGGGIVRTYSANFKDNLIDVSFVGSDNFYQTVLSNTNFFTTSALYAKGYNPQYHAHLWMGDGVIFKGCDFYNNYGYLNGISSSNWGLGILATLSNIIVQEYSTTNSSFEHLYYGIKLSQGESFLLQNSNFTDCLRGVWAVDNDGISITGCDFDVYFYNWLVFIRNSNFGLNLESCTGYLLTENTFRDGNVGMVIYNSGNDNNEIYKNEFRDISGYANYGTSLIAIGDNTGFPNKTQGLQVKCNEFNDVDYSIYITGGLISEGTAGTLINVLNADIAMNQSVNANDEVMSAMNYWTNMPTPNNDYRYFYVNPSHSTIANSGRYQYHCPYTTGYYLPDGSFNSTYVARIIKPASDCESIITKSYSIPSLISQTEDYTEYEAGLQAELDELTSYNDFSMEVSAQSANSMNSSVVYNDLSAASPYLTSDILIAYLNNTNVSELSRTSLMLANSPLPTDVVKAVEESDLSTQYKVYILNNQVGDNRIELIQNQIEGVQSARQVNYDHIVRATFNSDTTPDFAETYSTVLGFMETQTDLHAQKKLADLYAHKNMFNEALSILNDLANIALSNDDISLYNHVQLKKMKNDIEQTHSVINAQQIVIENEEFLRELAADYNTKEGGAARAMLESAGLWDNFPIVFLPNPEQTMEDRSAKVNNYEDSQELIPELESLFSIYPNPADNYLSIEFINPEGNCTFSILTIKGDLVKTVSTNQQLGFMSIDISNLEAGNYIINCKELNSSQSFMIVR